MSYFFKTTASDVIPDFKEAARYAGFKTLNMDENSTKLVTFCISKMKDLLVPQAVYEIFDLKVEQETVQFADIQLKSADLSKNLHGCKKIILLAATIGTGVDKTIRRSQLTGSADGAVMQATGAMFIESFVDSLNQKLNTEMKEKGYSSKPRYSPGYGDVPLSFQKEFFRLLPCDKIGLTLMDSLIMAPEKSVTAFIGYE